MSPLARTSFEIDMIDYINHGHLSTPCFKEFLKKWMLLYSYTIFRFIVYWPINDRSRFVIYSMGENIGENRRWHHQVKTCSALLALCAFVHRWLVNSPHKGQWGGALIFSLICTWTNDWANNRDVGDLRRHHPHYVVIVITFHTPLTYCVTVGQYM